MVSDKSHFEVYDAATGELRFERDGSVAEVNRYGTLLLTDGTMVTALDPMTGDVLWDADGSLGAFCRDIVIVVAAHGDDTGSSSRSSSSTTARARSAGPATSPSTLAEHEITCGYGPYVYTHRRRRAPRVGRLQRVAQLVASDRRSRATSRSTARLPSCAPVPNAETIVAVERDTGEILWERPAAEVGKTVFRSSAACARTPAVCSRCTR